MQNDEGVWSTIKNLREINALIERRKALLYDLQQVEAELKTELIGMLFKVSERQLAKMLKIPRSTLQRWIR